MSNTEKTAKAGLDRRSFLKRSSFASMALLPVAGLLSTTRSARAGSASISLSDGDVAVLQFLRAAEFVEADLWGQYAELAFYNKNFRAALKAIDPALPEYVMGDHQDELSHANFITGFLENAGVTPVDLSSFYTLPAVNVTGVDQSKKRLTNLTNLTIDTSWYLRYRNQTNPDFGGTYAQTVNITNRPTVPTSNSVTGAQLDIIAQTAAFHFGAIEQGGSSLYLSLLPKVTNLDVVSILGAIGPTEFYHFATFQTALEGIRPMSRNGLVFPDLKGATNSTTANIFQTLTPRHCAFLDPNLPECSVIRPSSTANAGAVAAASGLAASGLFAGQPQGFVDAVVMLAQAADAAARNE
ncbi:MAG TPA: ferritin-like domain-containing protein [Verrucomicrobiae bacterium]|nr:ferritin-like domain-containing protein [Verrucomicrobiae bacterium]